MIITETNTSGTKPTTSTINKPAGTSTITPLSSQYKAGVENVKRNITNWSGEPKNLALYQIGYNTPLQSPPWTLPAFNIQALTGSYNPLSTVPSWANTINKPTTFRPVPTPGNFGASGYSYATGQASIPGGSGYTAQTSNPWVPSWANTPKWTNNIFQPVPKATIAPYYQLPTPLSAPPPQSYGSSGYSYVPGTTTIPGGSGYTVPTSAPPAPAISSGLSDADRMAYATNQLGDKNRSRGENRDITAKKLASFKKTQDAMMKWKSGEAKSYTFPKPPTPPVAPPPPTDPFGSGYGGWGGSSYGGWGGGGGGWGGYGWEQNLINWNVR